MTVSTPAPSQAATVPGRLPPRFSEAARPARVAAPRAEPELGPLRRSIAETLQIVADHLPVQRRLLRAGDTVYQAGEAFGLLYVVNSGFFKVLTLSPDGREQVVGLKFRGDWLGFDGLAQGAYSSDAVAMDVGEVWAIKYEALLEAALRERGLMTVMHQAMSRELAREREALMSVCTLPGDARVADFLCHWADALAERGLRTDQIALRLTRAEIGNCLGLTLETVSRALSRLAKARLIGFEGKGRRDLSIPDVAALSAFVQGTLTPHPTVQ
jgi:CRP/FNR family transcriptional regulator